MIAADKDEVLISCDLSQAETWIVAYLANDEKMKWALINDDIHSTTAAAIFELNVIGSPKQAAKDGIIPPDKRYTGKRVNHATTYRMSAPKFCSVYNSDAENPITVGQARRFQDLWFDLYTGIKPWWLDLENEARRNDRFLVTPYGRRMQFVGKWNNELLKEMTAYKPQSTVADHFRGRLQKHNEIPGGLLEFQRKISKYDSVAIRQQGHDSALVSAPKSCGMEIAELLRSCLDRPVIVNGEEVRIPVDGEMGDRWGELEKITWRN